MIYFYYKDSSLLGNARYKKEPIFDLSDLTLKCKSKFKTNPIFLHYTINPPYEVAVGAQLQDLQNGIYVTKPFITHIQSLNWEFEEEPIFTMANENILCPKCSGYMKVKFDTYKNEFLWKCKRRCNGRREAINDIEKDKEFNVFRVILFDNQKIKYNTNVALNHKPTQKSNVSTNSMTYSKNKILGEKLFDFEWTVRTINCFKNENMIFVSDLIKFTEQKLLRIPNFGRKSLWEVEKFLESYGLELGTPNNIWEINDDFHNDLSAEENIELGLKYNSPQESFDHLYFASKQGSSKAMFWIANFYGGGEKSLNILPNYDEQKKWLIKAAEKGSTDAYFDLARNASTEDKDNIEAIKWFNLVVENEVDERTKGIALSWIGEIYEEGKNGVEKSYFEALRYFKLSSDLGFEVAHFFLGKLYYYGRGVEVDYDKAFYYFELAYLGKVWAAYELLAMCYENGHGVSKDLEKGQQIRREQDQLMQEYDLLDFNQNLFISLSDYEWSIRTNNCFENSKILYVGDLIQFTQHELLRIPNFGRKSLKEVKLFLSSLDLELGTTLESWPPENIKKLSETYSPKRSHINTTSLTSLFNEKTILSNIEDYLESFSERDQKIILARSGLYEKSKTLEFLGRQLKLTRERVRQIEKKTLFKLSQNFAMFPKLVDELSSFIKGSEEPIPISTIETKYSYLSDLSDNLDFYIYVFSKVINYSKLDNILNVFEIDGSYFLTRFTKKEYEKVNLDITNQINSLLNQKVTRENLEQIFNNLPVLFSDFNNRIKQIYLSSCLFEQNDEGDEIFVGFVKRKSAGLAGLGVILDSLTEMTGNEIVDQVEMIYPGIYEKRNILNQLFDHKVYPFSHGTFGMIRHLPFNFEVRQELINEINVEIEKKKGTEYHSREILPYLSSYFSERLNDFKLSAVIREYELDNYLGRNMFGPPNTRRTKIFDVIVDVLRQEGRRMHASEILSKVNEVRSVDMAMQIVAKQPVIHLGDNMFDLDDR